MRHINNIKQSTSLKSEIFVKYCGINDSNKKITVKDKEIQKQVNMDYILVGDDKKSFNILFNKLKDIAL